jgi:surface polysaccharide O-acyltransferase-like enzyme
MIQSPAQPLSPVVQEKLKLLSLISILIVLLNHAAPLSLVYDGVFTKQPSPEADILLTFWFSHVGRVNRPLFFFISGFLFFWTLKPGWSGWLEKGRKRVKSLLIPYLIWSLLGCVLFGLAYWLSPTRSLIGQRMELASLTWLQWLGVWLWNPVTYQLWYLRDLLLLIFLSPLISVLATRLGWLLSAGVMLAWFVGCLPSRPDEAGLAFFTLGVVMAKKRIMPDWDLRFWRWPCAAVWLLLCALNTWFDLSGEALPWMNKLANVSGMLAIWGLTDLVVGSLRQKLLKAANLTFFIYLTHEPLMLSLKKLIFKWVPYNGTNAILTFLFLPVVVLGLCLAVGGRMRRHTPQLFGLLMGGRGSREDALKCKQSSSEDS